MQRTLAATVPQEGRGILEAHTDGAVIFALRPRRGMPC